MNHLLFLVDPAPDAVEVAANLILMLMLERSLATPFPVVQTRTLKTGQIEITAEYGKNAPSAPLLHPLKTVKKSNTSKFTSYRRRRNCTASARPARIN